MKVVAKASVKFPLSRLTESSLDSKSVNLVITIGEATFAAFFHQILKMFWVQDKPLLS